MACCRYTQRLHIIKHTNSIPTIQRLMQCLRSPFARNMLARKCYCTPILNRKTHSMRQTRATHRPCVPSSKFPNQLFTKREVRAGSSIKPQISSATNAACISNSNVKYLVSCWPTWTVKEGDIAIYFVKDLGLALAPKNCPASSQLFKEVNNRYPGAPRHICTKFRAKNRRTGCVGPKY